MGIVMLARLGNCLRGSVLNSRRYQWIEWREVVLLRCNFRGRDDNGALQTLFKEVGRTIRQLTFREQVQEM